MGGRNVKCFTRPEAWHFNWSSCNVSFAMWIIIISNVRKYMWILYQPSSIKPVWLILYHLFSIFALDSNVNWQLIHNASCWKIQRWFNAFVMALYIRCFFCCRCWRLWAATDQTMPGCGSAWTSWRWAQRGKLGSRRHGESTVEPGGLCYSKLRTLSTK